MKNDVYFFSRVLRQNIFYIDTLNLAYNTCNAREKFPRLQWYPIQIYWQWWKHIYIYCYIYYITPSGIVVLGNECVFSHHKCKHKWNGMLASSISKHTKAYFLLRSLVKRYCIRTNDLFPFIYKHKRIYITNVNTSIERRSLHPICC